MKTAKNYFLVIAVISISASLLAGCPSPKNKAPKNSESVGSGKEHPPFSNSEPIRIAFVPSVETGGIELQLKEFEDELSWKISRKVEAKVVLSYAACIEQMAAGHFEIAMLPPLAYVLANDRYGVHVALKAVRNGSPTYRGEIITRVDSGIKTLEDLKGRTFGFTDSASTSGFLYPKTLLMVNGIDLDKDLKEYTMVGDHSAVVRAVLNGRVDAGACFDDARKNLLNSEPEVMDKIVPIAYTADIPADTVSYRKDCTGDFYDLVTSALLHMTESGKDSVLYKIYGIEALVPAQDSDYDPIREMVKTLNLDIEQEIDKK
ncbi:MAG: phosphate/phosphite/phosphonate ABC transporter substrate-binding protein [bacterium]